MTQAAGRPPSSQFIIDGQAPETVVYPASVDEVSRRLKEAHEHDRAISPVGHGAFLHVGGVPKRYEQALCTTALSTVVDYQPTDMTITVGAGLSLAQLQAILGGKRPMAAARPALSRAGDGRWSHCRQSQWPRPILPRHSPRFFDRHQSRARGWDAD